MGRGAFDLARHELSRACRHRPRHSTKRIARHVLPHASRDVALTRGRRLARWAKGRCEARGRSARSTRPGEARSTACVAGRSAASASSREGRAVPTSTPRPRHVCATPRKLALPGRNPTSGGSRGDPRRVGGRAHPDRHGRAQPADRHLDARGLADDGVGRVLDDLGRRLVHDHDRHEQVAQGRRQQHHEREASRIFTRRAPDPREHSATPTAMSSAGRTWRPGDDDLPMVQRPPFRCSARRLR